MCIEHAPYLLPQPEHASQRPTPTEIPKLSKIILKAGSIRLWHWLSWLAKGLDMEWTRVLYVERRREMTQTRRRFKFLFVGDRDLFSYELR